ncbi:protein kinase [bacterium]|nr:protein kinase [bacterium]
MGVTGTGSHALANPGRMPRMQRCARCQEPLAPDGTCPRCDADATQVAGSSPGTVVSPASRPGAARAGGPPSRFVPGDVVASRYRIVGLLGRGGMGAVYRAADLPLGQSVALKFLPAELARDPARLERFLGEVRLARRVTHPNVCRVYDIGEADGQHFLSMEYIDGEDLSSLLRRVGRLTSERAVEVARQICAGLAAAHDQGILHRDLKPANVMLDGRGQVRLTDFGLAGLAETIAAEDVAAGTPAYMAPEQLAGEQVTVRSDVYALGLVLYELFTGQRALQAETLAELRALHASSTPSPPSRHVAALDPAVEQVVLRCLEHDPSRRPASAMAVAAALPGGDPLAAALAAGETPSPELVAEVGARRGVRPVVAWGLAVVGVVLAIVGTRWSGTMTNTHYLPLDRSPAVLMDRTRTMLAELGYTEPVYQDPRDTAWGMVMWWGVVQEVAEADSSADRWQALRDRPDAASFWYRQSPSYLRPTPQNLPIFLRGMVQLTNPSPSTPGQVTVMLDLAGHLRRLDVMPKRYSTREPTEIDWMQLFELADLDPGRFTETRPRYQRFQAPDARRAWLGTRAEAPDVELRVEAGAYEGRPVLFNVATEAGLRDLGDDPEVDRPTFWDHVGDQLPAVVILLVALLLVPLTGASVGGGRADVRGAVRIAWGLFALFLLARGLRSHMLFTAEWPSEIWPILVGATFVAVIVWAAYMAAEPLGRRVWPSMFVSSSRLLSRPRVEWRDPLIGQSILIGLLVAGVDFLLRVPVQELAAGAILDRPSQLYGYELTMLRGQRAVLSAIVDQSMLVAMTFMQIATLVVVQSLVRRRWLAVAITIVVWTLFSGWSGAVGFAFVLVSAAIQMVTLLRWGVVALVVSRVGASLCWLGRASDWSAWWAEGAVMALVAFGVIAVIGAWSATATSGPSREPARSTP